MRIEKNSLILTIVSTSMLFGLAHLSNLFNPDFDILSVINQILFAISIGLFLQSLYIRTRSLILIICIQALINYFGTYKSVLLKPVENIDGDYNLNDFISTFITLCSTTHSLDQFQVDLS